MAQDPTHKPSDKSAQDTESLHIKGAPVLELNNVRMAFAAKGLRSIIQSKVGGKIVKDAQNRNRVQALNAIDFALNEGERVALIGHNGAGKSTLLRVMAGIIKPTEGEVIAHAPISTLFTTSVGLHNENSARRNIREACILLGRPKAQIPDIIEDVLEFSQLGAYADIPFKQLSSGMRARVCFGLATYESGGAILIDEIFGTGDASFRKRAEDRLNAAISSSGALVFASHSPGTLRMFCTEGLVMSKGEIVTRAPLEEALELYGQLK